MFAKRHRRSEEEEPLVPHGLIWQAMEEPSPAEEHEAQERASSPGNQLQIVPPLAQVPASQSSVQVSPTEADLASQKPAFWHKAAKLEVVKPVGLGDGPTMSPQASIPVVAAAETEPQKQSLFFHRLDLIRQQVHRVNIARSGLAAGTRKFLGRWEARALVFNFRKFFGAIFSSGFAVLVEARGKIRERRYWEGLKRRVGGIGTLVVAGIQKASATAQRGHMKVKVRAETHLLARRLSVQHEAAPAETPVDTPVGGPIIQQRLKPRILVDLSKRVLVVLKRLLPARDTFHAIRRDSQLWTSFAMAGLSASLLLGFVLTVKHYGTEALPSHVLHDSSLTESAPAEAATVPKTPASRTESAPTPHRNTNISPKPAAPKPAARARVAPKPRHHPDNDYVARDTFVSYENRRNSSH
jgi:hypothetical protein